MKTFSQGDNSSMNCLIPDLVVQYQHVKGIGNIFSIYK